MTEQPQPSNAH